MTSYSIGVFTLRLISLSIITSKFIHVVANGKQFSISYGWIVSHCVCVCVCVSYLLHALICWWTLRLPPYLGYCAYAAMNTWVLISFQISVFCLFRHIPRSGISGLYDTTFSFLEIAILLSTLSAPIYVPTNSALGFHFLHILTNICYL